MPTQLEKVEARAAHLLDGFLFLRERYALLDPMLFNREVQLNRGSGRQARGFASLRITLVLACAQDIAKLVADTDERAPSIHNIVSALRDPDLVAALKSRYAIWVTPSIEDETDPEIIEALRRRELGKRRELSLDFDKRLSELRTFAENLLSSPVIKSFRTIRDKITAHTEVLFVADKYQPFDIGDLGLKWQDLENSISSIQRAVELIGAVARNASFAWDMLDKQLPTAANEFWLPSSSIEPLTMQTKQA